MKYLLAKYKFEFYSFEDKINWASFDRDCYYWCSWCSLMMLLPWHRDEHTRYAYTVLYICSVYIQPMSWVQRADQVNTRLPHESANVQLMRERAPPSHTVCSRGLLRRGGGLRGRQPLPFSHCCAESLFWCGHVILPQLDLWAIPNQLRIIK